MIQGIIFDMDGVLIDSHRVHQRAWRRFLATHGKQVSDRELEFILEGRRREEILQYFLGALSTEAIAEYGREKARFFDESFDEIKLLPGVGDFLGAVENSDLKTGIATSASSSRTWGTLRRLKLEEKFTAIVTGDDVAAGKPDPSVYRLTAERMNVSPANLIALEDAPCGVLAARSAGMRCVGVATNGRAAELLEAGAAAVIPDFVGLSLEGLMDSCCDTRAGNISCSQPNPDVPRPAV